jgi:hypothetical protein
VSRTYGIVATLFQNIDFGSNPIGIGMGRGAAATSALLTGRAQFLAGEDEFSRELYEFGPLPGSAFALFRLLLAAYLMGRAVARARDQEDPLALLLAPMMLATVAIGVILEQPTEQGFLVIAVGFSLAALKPEASSFQQEDAQLPRGQLPHRNLNAGLLPGRVRK